MKNQITKTLPRIAWESVTIVENNEPLVEISKASSIKTGLISKEYEPLYFIRQTVAEKLLKISERLPQGIHLVLIEGYRTLESQQGEWDREFQKTKEEYPTWIDEKIEQQVRLVVAKPAPLANHHCGGAVDVTLSYADGTLLDMGTPYISQATDEDGKNFVMLSDLITDEQKANRKILLDAMETEDFVWYPGEWWHYCWGDRMWAVYSHQTKCYYGPIEL